MTERTLKKRNFLVQGTILAIAGILCRLIGMLYRMPLVDIIGTKGNGYYTSAYSIYNILLVASSYSMPTAMSKIISQRLSEKRPEDARRAMKVAFLYSTFIGAMMSALLYFGAGAIANLMQKPFLKYVLITFAPTVWIMAYLGILRGYFQGTGNMVPTATSQIIEQLFNAVFSIVMAKILFGYGQKSSILYESEEYQYAFGAAGGTIGTGIGALVALLFFICIYFLYGREYIQGTNAPVRSESHPERLRRAEVESYSSLFSVLMLTLTPILLSSVINNINTVVDDFVFSNVMAAVGMAESVVFLWGIFGEYRIIFNIPVAIANSYSSSIIPSLTQAVAQRDRKLIIQKLALGIRFTMIIAIPAAVGTFALAEPICAFLFPTETTGTLVNVLRIGSPAVVLYSLTTITTGILHGLGHYRDPLVNSIIGLILHVIVLVVFLLIAPGIYAVMAATLVMGLVISLLNMRSITKYVHYHQYLSKTYLVPFGISVIMGIVAYLGYKVLDALLGNFLTGRLGTGLILIVTVAVAVAVYFVLLFIARPFRADELILMPLGTKLYALAKKFHLMK